MSKNKDNHKYIAKIKVSNNKFRYFYDLSKYKSFLHKSKSKTDVKSNKKKSKIEKVLNKVISKMSTISKTTKNNVEKLFDKNGNKTLSEVKEKVDKGHKYIAKVKLSNNKYRYFYNKEEYESYLKGDLQAPSKFIQNENISLALERIRRLSVIEGKHSIDEDMSLINQKYDKTPYDYAYNTNCAYCTVAYDLRRRGFDVEAGPMQVSSNNLTKNDKGIEDTTIIPTTDNIRKWYPNAETINGKDLIKNVHEMMEITTPFPQASMITDKLPKEKKLPHPIRQSRALKEAEKKLISYGDGARGMFNVYWSAGGSGHSMAWEVQNGKVFVIDAQTNEKDKLTYYGGCIEDDFEIIRTDNVSPSPNLLKIIRNRQ